MNLLSINFIWLFLIIISLNFICLIAIRSEERFWLPQMVIWILLFGTLLFRNTLNGELVVQKEIVYAQQTNPDDESNRAATAALEAARKTREHENVLFIRLLGIQSLICFVLQLAGYRSSGKKQFRSGAVTMGLFFLAYLLFELIRIFQDTPASASPL